MVASRIDDCTSLGRGVPARQGASRGMSTARLPYLQYLTSDDAVNNLRVSTVEPCTVSWGVADAERASTVGTFSPGY